MCSMFWGFAQFTAQTIRRYHMATMYAPLEVDNHIHYARVSSTPVSQITHNICILYILAITRTIVMAFLNYILTSGLNIFCNILITSG